MSDVKSRDYFSDMITALEASRKARDLWIGSERWTNPQWTSEMTRVLVAAAKERYQNSTLAGKGVGDSYGRCEYLTVDVTAYDNGGWSAPILIVEHENSPSVEKLQYCTWKLLSIYAEVRVLVAYVDTTRRYTWCKGSAAELRDSLSPVLRDHPGKSLSLFVGDWGARIDDAGWRGVFSQLDCNVAE